HPHRRPIAVPLPDAQGGRRAQDDRRKKSIDAVRHFARVTTRARLSGRDVAPPPFPAHLRHYLPGRMKLTDLEPAAYWAADVIDLELGRAVQQAWHEGVEA